MTEWNQEIADWQTKLERAFGDSSGVLGERVQQLQESERTHGLELTRRLAGFTTLIESYQDFALQSLDEVAQQSERLHILSFAFHVAAIRRVRAALNEFYDGYYLDALGTLRGVFEITMLVGAVLKGHFSFNDLYDVATAQGISGMDPLEVQKLRHRHTVKIDNEIRARMFGVDSALTRDEQRQIIGLLKCLHISVHRGEANVAFSVLTAVQGGQLPRVAPRLDLQEASMFCNPAAFLAWAHVRALLYVTWPVHYSVEWQRKHALLDESFRFFFDGWAKQFAVAVVHLIDTSFQFDEAQASKQVTAE